MRIRGNDVWFSDFYAKFGIFLLLAVQILICAVLSPQFLTLQNTLLILRQNAIITIIVCGTEVVLLCGEMDFSQGALAASAGCLAVILYKAGVPIAVSFLAGLLTGALFGLFNGVLVTKCRIPSFVMTLATQKIARGVTLAWRNGHPSYEIGGFTWMGQGKVAGVIPTPISFMIVILVWTWFLLNETSIGRHFYAVGGNVRAAQVSGIRTDWVKTGAFVYAGMTAALGGMILMARIGSGQPAGAEGYEFEAVTAAIIGGTSIGGGEGNIYGMFAGALFVGVLNNFMTITRVNAYWQQVVQGAMIAVAVILDARVHERYRNHLYMK